MAEKQFTTCVSDVNLPRHVLFPGFETLCQSSTKFHKDYKLQFLRGRCSLSYWINENWNKISELAMTLHFLTFLAFPQHGVSQLSQNCCFHFIMDNEGFLRWMHIYVTSFYLPVNKGKKLIKWEAQKTHQSRNQLPAMQTPNPSSALLPHPIPSHTAVPKPGASGIFLVTSCSTKYPSHWSSLTHRNQERNQSHPVPHHHNE